MAGLFKRQTIMAATGLLNRLGLVHQKQKPSCDRTYQYLLLPSAVQERINLAAFWDASLKLVFWRFVSAGWIDWGCQWLKALWGAIVQDRTMQEPLTFNASPQDGRSIVEKTTRSIDTLESSLNTANIGAAAFLQKPVEEEASSQSLAALVDQTELVNDEPEYIDEDHFSDAPESQKLDPEEYRQVFSEVRAADIPLSPELQRLVFKSTVDTVRNALAYLLECRKKGTVKNPAGYLYRAIQGQWKPAVADIVERKSTIPEEVMPPSDDQMATLDECKAKGTILDHFLSTLDGRSVYKVVMPNRLTKLWWEFLAIEPKPTN